MFSLYALSDFLYVATTAFVLEHVMEVYEEVKITLNITTFDLGSCKWSEHCNNPFYTRGKTSRYPVNSRFLSTLLVSGSAICIDYLYLFFSYCHSL